MDRIGKFIDRSIDPSIEANRVTFSARAATRMRYTMLDPLLEDLARESRIKRTIGEHDAVISLKD